MLGKKIENMQYACGPNERAYSAPYPPQNADEVRLTQYLERIERKLDTILAALETRSITEVLPDNSESL